MAVVQQDKRKLEALYRQLYSTKSSAYSQKSSAYSSYSSKNIQIDKKIKGSEVNVAKVDLPKYQSKTLRIDYIKKDLAKILILSSVAILAQLLLYFASIRNIVSLNLF